MFETDISATEVISAGIYCSTTFSVANIRGLITVFFMKLKLGIKLEKLL